MRKGLSDEAVRAEIEKLQNSEDVKRGLKDANAKRNISKERQMLYRLRWLEKQGKRLAEGAIV